MRERRYRGSRFREDDVHGLPDDSLDTLEGLLRHLDRHFGGIVPTARELSRPDQEPARTVLDFVHRTS